MNEKVHDVSVAQVGGGMQRGTTLLVLVEEQKRSGLHQIAAPFCNYTYWVSYAPNNLPRALLGRLPVKYFADCKYSMVG